MNVLIRRGSSINRFRNGLMVVFVITILGGAEASVGAVPEKAAQDPAAGVKAPVAAGTKAGNSEAPVLAGSKTVEVPSSRQPGKASSEPAKKAEAGRDPFAVSPRMKQQANVPKAERGFEPTTSSVAQPTLRLKGYVEAPGKEAIALIEVAGSETYLVREGDVVSIGPAGTSLVLKIIELSHLRASVQIGTLDHVVVVR